MERNDRSRSPECAVDLTTEELTKRVDLPLAWTGQRALLGFD